MYISFNSQLVYIMINFVNSLRVCVESRGKRKCSERRGGKERWRLGVPITLIPCVLVVAATRT